MKRSVAFRAIAPIRCVRTISSTHLLLRDEGLLGVASLIANDATRYTLPGFAASYLYILLFTYDYIYVPRSEIFARRAKNILERSPRSLRRKRFHIYGLYAVWIETSTLRRALRARRNREGRAKIVLSASRALLKPTDYDLTVTLLWEDKHVKARNSRLS